MNNDDIKRSLYPAKPVKKAPTILFAENKYCPDVKISNWWYYREGFPKDYDAYHPPGDTKRSSYKRLSTMPEERDHWLSETHKALQEGPGDPLYVKLAQRIWPQPMLNFGSYKFLDEPRRDVRPEECGLPSLPKDLLEPRYTTTVAADYRWVWTLPNCPAAPDKREK